MYPCGFYNAGKSPLLRYPMIYALRMLGLPYNKIIEKIEPVFSEEELLSKIEASPGSVILWDDVGHWMHKPIVYETWPLLAWWDFQRWTF